MSEYPVEPNALAEERIPTAVYWGVQTQRTIEQAHITGQKPYLAWVWGVALVKRAAAEVNADLGLFKDKSVGEQVISGEAIAQAIIVAADEVLEGRWQTQFVVDPFQTEAGATHDMNLNEVLASLANERLGYRLADSRKPISPQNHVNLSQTTADTLTTAARLGCLWRLDEMLAELAQLAAVLRQKQHLEIFALSLERSMDKIRHSADDLRRLGIGATALDGDPEYHSRMVAVLGRLAALTLYESDNPLEAMNGIGDFVHFSGALRTLAHELIGIAQAIPSVSYSTSAVAHAQMLHMAMLQLLGNDLTILLASQIGPTIPHPALPLIAHNLFQSMDMLINSTRAFGQWCVSSG